MQDRGDSNVQHTIDASRLRRFELFSPLQERELAAIARCCQPIAVPAGTLVFRQGGIAKNMYFLEDGVVNVYREKSGELHRIALIESPAIFGEVALVNRDQVHTESVRAATELRAFSISFSNMTAALRHIPVLKEQLRQLLLQRSSGTGEYKYEENR